MKARFPAHWECVAIGDVTRIAGGGTPPSKDAANFTNEGGVPWVTPADLSGYRSQYVARGARNLSEAGFAACSASKMPAGSVLFSSRAPIGYVAIASNEITTNQGFKSFVLPAGLESRFVYYYLRHIKPIAEAQATGTTFKELSGAAAAKLPLLVAPFSEQKRIADKLDTVLARVDAANDHLARVAPLLKRFRQSVLAAATSGRLTEDWRGSTELCDSWRDTNVGGLTVDLRYGTSKKCGSTATSTAVLRIPNVGQAGRVELDDLKYADFDEKELEKLALKEGDLLVIRSNGSVDLVGRTCIVDSRAAGMLFAGYLIRLRVDLEKVIPKFLWLTLSGPVIRERIEATARSTSGVNNVNSEELRALPVRIPNLEEQAEIVQRVELLFAYADRIEARLQAARTAAERLTPALLAKAFRGELVPQVHNDEPASGLLRRLQANASSSSTKTGRKRSV